VSRIQLSTLALSHCVPGGNAAASTLSYRLLTRAGVGGTDTAFALATQGLGSAVVLNVIFWLALLASLPIYGFRTAYLFVAILGLLLMAFIAALVVLMTKGNEKAMAFVNTIAGKVRFLRPETLPRFFGQLVSRVQQLSTDRRQLVKALFFASANWLFDVASLFIFLGAFGQWVNPVALLVAYGVANIAAAIPFTPGGLGVLELTLIGILVGFGPPRAVVILGVIAWRLVNFWLPIPVGGISYVSLRVHPPAGNPAGLAERRAVWRARWHWAVEIFGAETPAPLPSRSPSLIDKVVDSHSAVATSAIATSAAPPVGSPAPPDASSDAPLGAGPDVPSGAPPLPPTAS
jgi:uncharacterized protein (TIRG00374 family)